MTLDNILAILAPQQCIMCAYEGYILCPTCIQSAGDQIPPRCLGCRKLSDDFKTCAPCKTWLKVSHVYVSNNYDSVYERLVSDLKFSFRRDAAKPMAEMMASMVEDNNYDLICPLPTAPARIRQRGFDHTKLLSGIISKNLKISCVNALGRKSNVRQLGSTRSQRIAQMDNEFYYRAKKSIKGKNILLVDDVATSGASLAGAVGTLLRAGAKSVDAVVFAQKA